MADAGQDGKTKKPKDTSFTQQRLPACKPLLTPRWVLITCFTVAVVFIPLGAICLSASSSVVEYRKRYDDVCVPIGIGAEGWRMRNGTNGPPVVSNADRDLYMSNNENMLHGEGVSCFVDIDVEEDMEAEVYLYYELHNYFQNHRRYVISRSDLQLLDSKQSDVSECAPQKEVTVGEGEEAEKVDAYPCGLVAWSYFNDTYRVHKVDDVDEVEVETPVVVNERGIAWKTDIEDKFDNEVATERLVGGNLPFTNNLKPMERGGGVLDPTKSLAEDEHFVVWMRTAALPTFRKLWGRIEEDIPKGTKLRVHIDNRYNTYRFDGKKYVVLSTASWLGGKNAFLGTAYIIVGAFAALFGLVFLGLHLMKPRALGDTDYLSWNK